MASATGSEPTTRMAETQPPAAVTYVCVVLWVQACFWCLSIVLTVVIVAGNPHRNGVFYTLIGVLVTIVLAAFAIASAVLAARLPQGRNSARVAAIALESFMACFGVFIAAAATTAGRGALAVGPVLVGIADTGVSIAAVIGLLGNTSRAFTAPPLSRS